MSSDFCYLPILRAKQGEFEAVRALSPDARARLSPLFDVPDPVPGDGPSQDAYLAKCAQGIHQAWGPAREIYVDVHDLPLNLRTASGAQPINLLFDLLRMHGSKAIPVTGTEAERGRGGSNNRQYKGMSGIFKCRRPFTLTHHQRTACTKHRGARTARLPLRALVRPNYHAASVGSARRQWHFWLSGGLSVPCPGASLLAPGLAFVR